MQPAGDEVASRRCPPEVTRQSRPNS